GEQGSAKSTNAKVLRRLIDPNTALLRAEPREARDLAIAAHNAWLIAFDNLSWLSDWLSDALCRVTHGEGFAVRTHYENDEETIFSGQRPVTLNGIGEVITKGDLLDRALLVTCPPIPEKSRTTEEQFWSDFAAAHSHLLGAVLDAVSTGLKRLPEVKRDDWPR